MLVTGSIVRLLQGGLGGFVVHILGDVGTQAQEVGREGDDLLAFHALAGEFRRLGNEGVV